MPLEAPLPSLPLLFEAFFSCRASATTDSYQGTPSTRRAARWEPQAGSTDSAGSVAVTVTIPNCD